MVINKSTKIIQKLDRQGEGDLITIVRHPVGATNGASQQVSFDLSSARVPDRRYPAEIGGIEKTEYMVRMYFGQSKLVGSGINTLLVIHVPFVGIKRFIESMRAGVEEKAQAYFKKLESSMPSLLDLSKETEQPASIVTLEANVIAFAFHGREACLDFYHASPFVWDNLLSRGGKFYAEPVVRVTLPTSLTLSMINSIESQLETFPSDDLEATK